MLVKNTLAHATVRKLLARYHSQFTSNYQNPDLSIREKDKEVFVN